jgi:hypothetical protein
MRRRRGSSQIPSFGPDNLQYECKRTIDRVLSRLKCCSVGPVFTTQGASSRQAPKPLTSTSSCGSATDNGFPALCGPTSSALARRSTVRGSALGNGEARLGRYPHVLSRSCSFRSNSTPDQVTPTCWGVVGSKSSCFLRVRLYLGAKPESERQLRRKIAMAKFRGDPYHRENRRLPQEPMMPRKSP